MIISVNNNMIRGVDVQVVAIKVELVKVKATLAT